MYYVDKLSLDYAWTSGHARTGRARAWRGGGPKINGWVLVLLQNLFRAELILRGSIFNVTVLAGGGLKTTKRRLLGFQIVHVCFPEVGDSVVGVLCLEILRAKLPHE